VSIHFYRDLNGVVGEPDPPANTPDTADEAMRRLYSTVEALAMLTDRHRGDSGADADMIDGWDTLLESVAEAIRTHLGEPRIIRHGVLVPVGMMP
jgi:hypothetical protein